MAEFISLYSGSSGNSSVVRCGAQYLIVDMGKGVRTTTAALKSLGLAVSDCAGILVTHEHSDHVKGLSTFLKKNPLPVYGAAATLDFLDANDIVPANCELNTLEGREEDIGVFGVKAFPTSHDVPVSFLHVCLFQAYPQHCLNLPDLITDLEVNPSITLLHHNRHHNRLHIHPLNLSTSYYHSDSQNQSRLIQDILPLNNYLLHFVHTYLLLLVQTTFHYH